MFTSGTIHRSSLFAMQERFHFHLSPGLSQTKRVHEAFSTERIYSFCSVFKSPNISPLIVAEQEFHSDLERVYSIRLRIMLICDSTHIEYSPVTGQSILREHVSHEVQLSKSKVTFT
jgi:hypothetical protein